MQHRKVTPGILAVELSLAGLHTMNTLWYRLPTIAAGYASAGHSQPEYGKMLGEKAAAWLDGMWDAQVEAMRIAGEAATGRLAFADMAAAPARIAAAGLRPAFRRVKANSRRLGRRSRM